LRPYRLEFEGDGSPTTLRGDRYEFWIYRQVRKRLEIGELYPDNSIRRRRFSDELVSVEQKAEALKSWDIPWLRQPLYAELEGLADGSPTNSTISGGASTASCVKVSSNTSTTIRPTKNCRGASPS
jgi:hypothetical protein